MIEIKNLTKKYGAKTVVDNISFTVESGEILGFLGPNGAGKTTTMNILTGYISSTEGTAAVGGFDILENPREAKKKIGYLPENPPLYMDMTVIDFLNFVYELKGVTLPRNAHINEIMELVSISDVKGRLIKNLSKGYKQRVGMAQALIGNPEVLILDEPTVGLDPKQIIEIRNVIKSLGKEHTIILSSHILPEVSAVCDRIIIINNGKIVAIDTPQSLSAKMAGENKFVVQIEGAADDVLPLLLSVDGVANAELQKENQSGVLDIVIEGLPEHDIRKEIFFKLAEKQLPILSIRPLDLSLEDIFLKLTTTEEVALETETQAEQSDADGLLTQAAAVEKIEEIVENAVDIEEILDAVAESSEMEEGGEE